MPSNSNDSINTFVHKCRFIQHQPSAINALAFTSPESKLKYLACVRENGSIELWNPKAKGWYLEKTIAGSPDVKIESIVFCNSRLFAASLDGRILEYDIQTLALVQSIDSNGGAIWCMTTNDDYSQLAIGCEDGCIRIFSIENEIQYLKTFERHDGRILSIDWDSAADTIVSGSDSSTIRKYNATTGKSCIRMTVDTAKNEETIVWGILILKNRIVSADSLGRVSFWDLKNGTLVKTIRSHAADVLCLTTNKTRDAVFSSGVDRKVIQYKMAIPDKDSSWMVSGEKRYHSHDVRAILWIEERPFDCLVTGGMDTLLIMSSDVAEFPEFKQYRMPFFPLKPTTQLAKSARLIMHAFEKSIKVWKLGHPTAFTGQNLKDKQRVQSSPYELMFELNLDSHYNIQCSAITDNATYIAVSDSQGIKMFSLKMHEKSQNYKIKKLKTFPSNELPCAYSMIFTPDSTRLIISGMDGLVYIAELYEEDTFRVGKCIYLNESMQVDSARSIHTLIPHLAISADGQWLATADHKHQVTIINMDSYKIHSKLAVFDSSVTSLTFDPTCSTIVITLASNFFYLYNVESCAFTDWSREYSNKMPTRFTNRKSIIMGCSFDSKRKGVLILWGPSYFCTVDLLKPVGSMDSYILNNLKRKEIEAKIALKTIKEVEEAICLDSDKEEEVSPFSESFKMDHRFSPLMFLDYINDEMVVVERQELEVMKALPQGFYKHHYGT